jgi:hypothetical protein
MEEQGLLQQLENTAFACSSLIRFSGGSANYVYRGILMHAMPTRGDARDMESVIVKYSLGHVPGNAKFKLDLSRCVCPRLISCPIKAKESMCISLTMAVH